MAKTFLISTVAAGTVTLNDLGARAFTHPVTNYDLTSEYELERLRDSVSLRTEIAAGTLTGTFDGVAITSGAIFDNYMVDFDRKQVITNTTTIGTLSGLSHTQNTDTSLDLGGANPVTAAQILAFINSKAQINGLASLGADGRIPASQIPLEAMEYKGNWNPATNTPTLANTDTLARGNVYKATVPGTVDFGAGNITFAIGDFAINNGTIWELSKNSDTTQKGSQTLLFSENGSINGSRDLKYGSIVSTVTQATCTYTGVIRAITINSADGVNATYQVTVSINGSVVTTKTITATDKLNDFALNQAITAGDRVKVRFVKTSSNISDLNVCLTIIES